MNNDLFGTPPKQDLPAGRPNQFNIPMTVTPSHRTNLPAGMVRAGNIDLQNRPVVHNEDGSISSVRSMSFNDGPNREVLVPTVSGDGRLISNAEAIANYRKTGRHLGVFTDPMSADDYANRLHLDYAEGKIPGYPAVDGGLSSVGDKMVRGGNTVE